MPEKKLRRGFVKEAHSWASELRAEMGIPDDEPLCPRSLCAHLSVPVYKLSELPACAERALLLSRQAGCGFSAAACFDGIAAFIVLNDANEEKRQASDLAHEVAHIILRHTPVNPFVAGGKREYSPTDEFEAEHLGPTLLLSEAAALRAYRLIQSRQQTLISLSESWKITKDVINLRINKVGAPKRVRIAAE